MAEDVIILRIDGNLKQSNSNRDPAAAVLLVVTTTHSQRKDESKEILENDMFLPKSNSSSHLDGDHLSNCFLLSNMAAIEQWRYESTTFGREQSDI